MSYGDLYDRLSGLGAYDARKDMYEMESRRLQQAIAKQQAEIYRQMGMRDNPLGMPPTAPTITQPEPSKVLLLLGEDA